jgi:hypothetical protein
MLDLMVFICLHNVYMDDQELQQLTFVQQILDPIPGGSAWGTTWESIQFPPGHEKPPKEAFEAKLQELIDAQPLKDLRAERDRRLATTDWVVIRATSTETPVPEAWATYMQALRDLPATTEDPANPVWPPVPE